MQMRAESRHVIGARKQHREAVNGEQRAPRAAAVRTLVFGYVLLTLSLLAIGLVLTHVLDGSVGSWDTHVNRWFVARRTDAWNSVTGSATVMLETGPVIAVALVVVALMVWRRRWREALVIVFGLTLEIAVFLSVTFVVARPRPDVLRLNSTPMTSSFPSGHTAAAIVLYGGIAIVVQSCTRNTVARAVAWIVAGLAVTVVGFSRVYRGMHHPTDVIVGAAFGIACLCFAVRAASAAVAKAQVDAAPSHVHHFESLESEAVA